MDQDLEKSPVVVQLPIMHLAPHRSLAYGYARAADLEAFTGIRQVAEAAGVATRLLYTYFDAGQNRFVGVMVLDFTSAQTDAAGISGKIRQLPGVELLAIEATSNGLAASEKHRLDVVGTPMAAFAKPIIGDTMKRLQGALGERGAAALFEAGEAAGRLAASGVPALVQTLGLALDPPLLRARFRDIQVFGWAELAALHADDNFAGEALLTNAFEAGAWQGAATTSQCHWLRGFISGALSTLRRTPFVVTEPECQAKGDQHCRMVFQPRAA